MLRVACLLGNAQTVGVQLEEGKALLPSQGDDPVQIVAYGGFSAGQLDVERATPGHQQVVLSADFLQGQVPGWLLSGAGKAHGTAEVTPVGQLKKYTAAVPLVALAQAAVVGTALFHFSGPDGGYRGTAVAC